MLRLRYFTNMFMKSDQTTIAVLHFMQIKPNDFVLYFNFIINGEKKHIFQLTLDQAVHVYMCKERLVIYECTISVIYAFNGIV